MYGHLKPGGLFKSLMHESYGQDESKPSGEHKLYDFEEFEQSISYKALRKKLKLMQRIKIHDLNNSRCRRDQLKALYIPSNLSKKKEYTPWDDKKFHHLVTESKSRIK